MTASAASGNLTAPAVPFSRDSFAIVHTPSSEMSAQRTRMTLARRCAVRRSRRTTPPNGPAFSAASHIRRSSSSVKMRARWCACTLRRTMPRTIGGPQSSCLLAYQFMMPRAMARQ
jgi:hypothetical protein